MKTPKLLRFTNALAMAVFASAWMALTPGVRANDWNTGVGWWNDVANWIGGVPDNTGGWAIGNIGNGGTALITNTVPHVSEAWAGNGGVAGTIIVTNGGTLPVDNWLVVGRTGGGGNTPLSTLIVAGTGIVNKTGDGFIIGDGTFCSGQVIVKDNARVNVTGGWNGIGNGNGGVGWLTLQDNAVYNVAGPDWNIGDYGSGRGHAFIKDSATLNVTRFWIGKTDTSFGRVIQTGGAIVGATGGNEWTIGGENSGSVDVYGYYDLSNGSFSTPNNFQIGRYGKGVIYQSGGSITVGSWTSIGRFSGGLGVIWVSGGTFSHTGTGTQLIVGENGRGEFDLTRTGILDCNLKLRLGNPGGVGIVNLNGGTARVPGIEQTGGTGYLNFNGATLQAKVNSISFISGLTEAAVYSGNAIIDTAGFDVSASQALLAPGGNGVQNIPITDGGAGYLAPPLVQIDASGSGSGATAVAQINPAAGTVTNILVTCSGYNYGGTPGVTLIGGGASIPATLGTPTLAAVSSGGLIKNGNGTLTLSGANTYTGATVVNAGKVVATTAATGNGSFSVASGAGFGVTLEAANAQLNSASLTLAASTLDIDLGAFGNPALAPLNVTGALAVSGAVTVNIDSALPQLGQFPLIKYGSRTGSGSFSLGTLPPGVVATIVTNVAGSIDLHITFVAAPRWDGRAGGTWDIGLTTNWVELSSGLAAYYVDGNPVLFNDSALGTTSVNLGVTVNPAKVTVNNSVLNYTLSGSGKISGTASLIKQGTGSVALNTLNDYAGATRIEGGTVSVTNLANGGQASAIGSASSAANNLVLANGALSYSGPAVAINRGYSVQATNSTIDAQSDLGLGGLVSATAGSSFVKTGPAKLTHYGAGVKELSGGGFPGYNVIAGTVLFDGTGGAQTNHNQNEFWVGSSINNGASLILSNTTLNVDSWLSVGRGNGSVGNISSATLYDSKVRSGALSLGYDNNIAGNLAQQTLTLNGTSTFTNNGDMNVGESGGSTSTILLNGSSAFYSAWRVHLGWHSGGIGNLTLANSSTMTVNAWFSVGNEGGTGTLTLKDNSGLWVLWDMNVTDVNTGDATLNIQNNAQLSFGSMFVAKGAGSIGLVNQTGGTAYGRPDGNEVQIGFHGQGTYNLSGGSIVTSNHWFVVGRWSDGPGILNVTGGSIHHFGTPGKLFRVGEDGTGVLNISGAGAVESTGDTITIGSNATGDGTVNLNGGSLQVRRVIGINGISAFNFNGGTLKAGLNANADFMTGLSSANVRAGGAVIDTGTNNIGIAQALLDGTGGGGLIKQGTGALYLNGANTYTGPTLVNAGTLGGSGSIAGAVTVAAGATLAPGTSIGTLTVGSLTLGGNTVMEVSKDGGVATSDLATVTGNLAFGGALTVVVTGTNILAVNDTFNLFDWGTRSGSFTATNLPANYTWDLSQLAVDGTIRVTGVFIAPTVKHPVYSGGNLIVTGTGGAPGGSYTWLTSTNVAAPAAQWTTNIVGTLDGSGAFSNALPVNASERTRFFRLRVP